MSDATAATAATDTTEGSMPLDLAVACTAMNSMRTIERTLRSVQGLASRVVVVDSGSTDGTIAACEALGAVVVPQPWLGYAAQKQRAVDLAGSAAWILLLDSDEILTPELRDEIRAFVAKDDPSIAGAWLKRRHWYKGGWIRADFPDWQLRLFRRGRGRMSDRVVHETVRVEGPTVRLRNVLRHESWMDLDDAMTRTLRYAKLSAQVPGKRTSLARIAFNGPWAFLRNYLLRGAFLDGRRGFEISFVLAAGTTMKHLHIADRRPGGTADDGARPRP